MWKPVVGYKGWYEVSDRGLVRSVKRTTGHKRRSKILKAGQSSNGYLSVVLSRDNVQHTRSVHQLVLETFVGPANGKQTRHLDGNRQNNRLKNLCYGTASENALDRSRHGRGIGETHPRAILTERDVRAIRAWPRYGRGLYKRFSFVSPGAIDLARSGRNWKTVG